MTFHFSTGGKEAFKARAMREYKSDLPQDELIRRIEACCQSDEVAQIVIQNDMCDCCDFSALNVNISKELAKSLAEVLYRFPRVRSRVCFIGSKCGYESVLRKIETLDKDTISQFKIQNMFFKSDYIEMARTGLNMISNTEYNDRSFNILAQAFSMYGLLDAVVLDEKDFSGLGYIKVCNRLKQNARCGYHPKDCGEISYVFYHELGHIIDTLCSFTDSRKFNAYYNSLTKEQIGKEISQYATVDRREFFAELFAEYMSVGSSRGIVAHIGKMLIDDYRSLSK